MANIHAQELGRLGGAKHTPRQIEAGRKNLAKARQSRWQKKVEKNS